MHSLIQNHLKTSTVVQKASRHGTTLRKVIDILVNHQDHEGDFLHVGISFQFLGVQGWIWASLESLDHLQWSLSPRALGKGNFISLVCSFYLLQQHGFWIPFHGWNQSVACFRLEVKPLDSLCIQFMVIGWWVEVGGPIESLFQLVVGIP